MTRPLRGRASHCLPTVTAMSLKTPRITPYLPLKSQFPGRHQQHQCRHLPEQVDQSLVMFWNRHGSEIIHKMWRYTIPNRGLRNGAYPYDWEDGFLYWLVNGMVYDWVYHIITQQQKKGYTYPLAQWHWHIGWVWLGKFPIPYSATR
jgi:hypothetical protein